MDETAAARYAGMLIVACDQVKALARPLQREGKLDRYGRWLTKIAAALMELDDVRYDLYRKYPRANPEWEEVEKRRAHVRRIRAMAKRQLRRASASGQSAIRRKRAGK